MGHNGDLSDAWIARDAPEHHLKRIAREIGALPIVAILENAPARWPREKDRGYVRTGIMDDLSQSINGVVEAIVEAMHIDEDAPAMRQILFHQGPRLPHSGERGDFERGEISLGIGGQGCRPLHLTGPPPPGGRDGDGDPGQGNPVFALPCEENALIP